MKSNTETNTQVLTFDTGQIREGVVQQIVNGLWFVKHSDEQQALSYYPECLVPIT